VLRLRRSKTNQVGALEEVAVLYGSDPRTCPVRALQAWLATSGLGTCPLFRSVDRRGRIGAGRLTARIVGERLKKIGERAGLDPQATLPTRCAAALRPPRPGRTNRRPQSCAKGAGKVSPSPGATSKPARAGTSMRAPASGSDTSFTVLNRTWLCSARLRTGLFTGYKIGGQLRPFACDRAPLTMHAPDHRGAMEPVVTAMTADMEPSVARHSACILSNLSVCYMHARCSCN
jgi:hypothetical protein